MRYTQDRSYNLSKLAVCCPEQALPDVASGAIAATVIHLFSCANFQLPRPGIPRPQAAAASGTPPALRPALQLLASLYSMHRVEKDAAFFLAEGVMDGFDL